MECIKQARESLESFKRADKDRYDFVEHVLEQINALWLQKCTLEENLNESEYIRAKYRSDFESSQRELSKLKTSVSRSTFILVLVDGDAMPFRDEFHRQGTSGGETAARELRRAVNQYIQENVDIAPGFGVIVRVYSKMQYLDMVYRDLEKGEGDYTLYKFVQGFNRVHRLCEYVDAGNDKEGADGKVQDTMELFIDNVHCKHIILCASSDNSYTGFLRQFVDNVDGRITLVEAIPFPRDLAELAPNFLTTRFTHIFRDSKLPERAPRTRGDNGPRSPAATYASAISKELSAAQTPSAAGPGSILPTHIHSTTETPNVQKIRINKDNQRVDPKLPFYNKDIVPNLKARKLCNRHYLSHCHGCKEFDHDAKLNPSDVETLRWIARLSPCGSGTSCRDPNCVASHMCTYGAKCTQPDNCRYPRAMHHLDPQAARLVEAWYQV